MISMMMMMMMMKTHKYWSVRPDLAVLESSRTSQWPVRPCWMCLIQSFTIFLTLCNRISTIISFLGSQRQDILGIWCVFLCVFSCRRLLDWSQSGLHHRCHQGLLQHGDRRVLRKIQPGQYPSQELVVQQEQRPQTCLVRRDNEWRPPRKYL